MIVYGYSIEAAVETSGNAGDIKKRLKGGGRKRIGGGQQNINNPSVLNDTTGKSDELEEVFFMSEEPLGNNSNGNGEGGQEEETELLEFNSLLNSS